MSPPQLRRIRNGTALATLAHDVATSLPSGEWFVEQRGDVVRVFRDISGSIHVADLAIVDFLDGLARRDIVFVSWG